MELIPLQISKFHSCLNIYKRIIEIWYRVFIYTLIFYRCQPCTFGCLKCSFDQNQEYCVLCAPSFDFDAKSSSCKWCPNNYSACLYTLDQRVPFRETIYPNNNYSLIPDTDPIFNKLGYLPGPAVQPGEENYGRRHFFKK
jgi:hypothetical protein